MTAEPLNLKKLSNDTLSALHAYWYARLNARGGSWIVLVMQHAAAEMLAEIDAELQRRKPVDQEA